MSKEDVNVDALIRDLTDFQKEVEVEGLLRAAAEERSPAEQGLDRIEQALETFKSFGLSGKDDPGDLRQLVNIGQTYERLSHLRKAYETYEEALTVADRLGETATSAVLLNRMGRVLSRWGRWDEALSRLGRSRQLYEKLGDEGGEARAVLNRGIVLHEQGNYEAATAAYREALERAGRTGNSKIVANASNRLAVLATIQGDFDGALAQYRVCLGIFQEAGDERGMARAYQNLGMVHADRRDWNAAMDCYERGFGIARENGFLDTMAEIYLGRAELLLELGDLSMVALCCARARDIFRRIEDRLGEADTYRLLGRLFTVRGRWTTALGLLQDSLRLNEEYANPLNLAETHRDLGRLHAATGHATDARAAFEAALSGFRRLGAKVDAAQVERLIQALGAP